MNTPSSPLRMVDKAVIPSRGFKSRDLRVLGGRNPVDQAVTPSRGFKFDGELQRAHQVVELTRRSSRAGDLNWFINPYESGLQLVDQADIPSRGFKWLLEVFDRCDRAG